VDSFLPKVLSKGQGVLSLEKTKPKQKKQPVKCSFDGGLKGTISRTAIRVFLVKVFFCFEGCHGMVSDGKRAWCLQAETLQ